MHFCQLKTQPHVEVYFKRIYLFNCPVSDMFSPPDCTEIHVTRSVWTVLEHIVLGTVNQDKISLYLTPCVVLQRLNLDLSPYRFRMRNVGLTNEDFDDLMKTLKALMQYAQNVRGWVMASNID